MGSGEGANKQVCGGSGGGIMGAGKRIEVVLASSAVRNYLGPLFLILWSWPHTILSVVALMYRGGSYLELFRSLADGSVWKLMWSDLEVHGLSAAEMLMTFMVFQGTLLLVLPGTKYDGPRTVTGHVPQYKDTGLLAYAVSLGTLYVMTERLHFFKLSMVYDNLLSAMIIMNVFATVFCLCLYLKGRFYPSSTDNRFVGIFLSDYFRGIELYPRVGKFDVKMFTNCRFGMMSWPILCLVYAAKQKELYGSVSNSMWISVALQVIYCGKFFAWERGYMGTVDIIQDRGGYYICWGCLCLVPSLYTGHTLFLVNHPYNYPLPVAVSIFLAGIFFIFLNYWADLQRQTVRATDGKCTIWGKLLKSPPLALVPSSFPSFCLLFSLSHSNPPGHLFSVLLFFFFPSSSLLRQVSKAHPCKVHRN